ncbi:unnamed protein product [Linum trigynum]|uniref:Uncharacterized protein n=1 Tax=Linum trigynum TaxID=586398 RepID=A0AAV2CFX7_9ROSI
MAVLAHFQKLHFSPVSFLPFQLYLLLQALPTLYPKQALIRPIRRRAHPGESTSRTAVTSRSPIIDSTREAVHPARDTSPARGPNHKVSQGLKHSAEQVRSGVQAKFVKSSVRTEDCLSDGSPEFALVGKSFCPQ